jgi:TolB protein
MTFFAGEDTFASWSPDGTQIVYVSDRDGDQEVYVRRALGTDPPEALEHYSLRQITDNDVNDWSPAWSPDGQYIAYVSEDPLGYGINVMDAETGAPILSLDAGAGPLGNPTTEWNPAWIQTENGLSLMFVSDLTGVEGIYLIDLSRCFNTTVEDVAESPVGVSPMGSISCGYSTADVVTIGGMRPDGFPASQWAPDWRPLP